MFKDQAEIPSAEWWVLPCIKYENVRPFFLSFFTSLHRGILLPHDRWYL